MASRVRHFSFLKSVPKTDTGERQATRVLHQHLTARIFQSHKNQPGIFLSKTIPEPAVDASNDEQAIDSEFKVEQARQTCLS